HPEHGPLAARGTLDGQGDRVGARFDRGAQSGSLRVVVTRVHDPRRYVAAVRPAELLAGLDHEHFVVTGQCTVVRFVRSKAKRAVVLDDAAGASLLLGQVKDDLTPRQLLGRRAILPDDLALDGINATPTATQQSAEQDSDRQTTPSLYAAGKSFPVHGSPHG